MTRARRAAAGVTLDAGRAADQGHALADAVEADTAARAVGHETAALVAHLEHDVLRRAGSESSAVSTPAWRLDVAERFLGDAEEGEVGLLVEPGRSLVHPRA